MAKTKLKMIPMLFAIGALLLLSGCFSTSVEELYALPKASREYLELVEKIDDILKTGAEYSPPMAGPNRQSVQLEDIDGDGVNEALAFFSKLGDKNPLKVYIFKKVGDDYEIADVIEGTGTAIEGIRYIDMDGDGMKELVIGWRMSAAFQHLEIYSTRDFENIRIAEADYNNITILDLTGDGRDDVLLIRQQGTETPGEVQLFSILEDGDMVQPVMQLSLGLESVSEVVPGKLIDGTPAVFVEGPYDGTQMLTDIFIFKKGALTNITLDASSAISADTVRFRPGSATDVYYSMDLDGDGILETPFPRALIPQSELTYYAIDWRSFSGDGASVFDFTTFHNYKERWYFRFGDDWGENITVRRVDNIAGERTVVFSYAQGEGAVVDFLQIFALSGDNKEDRAHFGGRFTLLEEGDEIYAAEILEAADELPIFVNRQYVRENFHLIRYD